MIAATTRAPARGEIMTIPERLREAVGALGESRFRRRIAVWTAAPSARTLA
jgi:hypothetical protein